MGQMRLLKDDSVLQIERLIESGAKTIPTKLVKKLLKDYNKDFEGTLKLVDKMEGVLRKYGP